ncbi:hypothetical protein WN943_001068 [Citrus x changshan-huyou]
MGLGSKIFLLLGLVMTIVVLLTSTKVAALETWLRLPLQREKVSFLVSVLTWVIISIYKCEGPLDESKGQFLMVSDQTTY